MKRVLTTVLALLLIIPMFALNVNATTSTDPYVADTEERIVSFSDGTPLKYTNYGGGALSIEENVIDSSVDVLKIALSTSNMLNLELNTGYWGGYWYTLNWTSNYNAIRFWASTSFTGGITFDFKLRDGGTTDSYNMSAGSTYYLNGAATTSANGTVSLPNGFSGMVTIPLSGFASQVNLTNVCAMLIQVSPYYGGSDLRFGDMYLTNIKSDGSPVALSSELAVDETIYTAETEYTLINVFNATERPKFHTISGGSIDLNENGFAKYHNSMKLQTTAGTNFVSRTIVSGWGGNSTWSFTDFNLTYNAFRFYLKTDKATKLTLAVGNGYNPDGVINPDAGAAYYLNGLALTTGLNGTMELPAGFEGFVVIPFSSYTNAGFNNMCNLYFNVAAADAGAAIQIGDIVLTNVTASGAAVKTTTPANGVSVSSADSLCVNPVNGFTYYVLNTDLGKANMTYRADAVTCVDTRYGNDGSFAVTNYGDIELTFKAPRKSRIVVSADIQLSDTSGDVTVRLFKNSYGFELLNHKVTDSGKLSLVADNLVFNEGDLLIATLTKVDGTAASGNFVLNIIYEEINTEAAATEPGACQYVFNGSDVYAEANTDTMSFLAGLSTESSVSVLDDKGALEYYRYVPTGAVVTVGNSNYTVIVKGDADSTGTVNVLDMIELKSQLLGRSNSTGAKLTAMDMDSSGSVTIVDLLILRDVAIG